MAVDLSALRRDLQDQRARSVMLLRDSLNACEKVVVSLRERLDRNDPTLVLSSNSDILTIWSQRIWTLSNQVHNIDELLEKLQRDDAT